MDKSKGDEKKSKDQKNIKSELYKKELRAHEYTDSEQREIVVKNILTMLYNRDLFDKEKYEELYSKAKGLSNNERLYFVSKNGDKILIYFLSDQNIIKSSNLIKLIDIKNKNTLHLMIGLDQKVLKPLRELLKLSKVKLQVFFYKKFLMNLIDLEFLPKLMKIYRSKEDIDKLSKEFDSPSKFHKILESDPFSEYYHIKEGNVIKVQYLSETAGFKLEYLTCIKSK